MEKVKEDLAVYNTLVEKHNPEFFSIQQTVKIPNNRQIHLDFEIPIDIPTGEAQVELKVIPFVKKEEKSIKPISLLDLRGSCKGLDTMDAYFARKRADKAFEDGLIKENPYKIQEK